VVAYWGRAGCSTRRGRYAVFYLWGIVGSRYCGLPVENLVAQSKRMYAAMLYLRMAVALSIGGPIPLVA